MFKIAAITADKPFSFRPEMTTNETSQSQIDWVIKNHGVKNVGALFPKDETGQQVAIDIGIKPIRHLG